MRCLRIAESQVLGYWIERAEEYDDLGLLQSIHYEVLCPRTSAVLGSYSSVRAARRHVIVHELREVARGKTEAKRVARVA
jgi:hypothetical protein